MTRILRTRSSKRKAVSSLEVLPDDCKENSPLILSQTNSLKSKGRLCRNDKTPRTVQSSSENMKENISPETTKFVSSRKKASGRKINQNNHTKSHENVLCDRTNSLNAELPSKRNDSFCSLSQTTEGSESTLLSAIVAEKPNSLRCPEQENKEPHIPVYASGSSDLVNENQTCSEKNGDVYEFEFDENEEPVKAKKRKKKATVKKKTGAKAFTINNIKYSSTESLVSLPEKPAFPRKKTNRRPAGKINNAKNQLNTIKLDGRLNNNTMKCSSKTNFEGSSKNSYCVNSTTDILYKSNENCPASGLSVLMEESVSKESECSGANTAPNVSLSSGTTQAPNNISTSNCTSYFKDPPPETGEFRSSPSLSSKHLSQLRLSQNPVLNRDQQVLKPVGETVSKVSCNEATSHSISNYSTISSLDFLSSTPVKRTSHVLPNNSVFNQTFERRRPSSSFTNKCDQMHNTKDDLFGFDEPEELEEPLVSPIKHFTARVPKRQKAAPWTLFADGKAKPQPSAQEVIEILKASIPKQTRQEEITEAFNSSSEENGASSLVEEKQVATSFKKPPRRSYERQKRVHYREVEEEEVDDDEGAENQKPVPEKPKQVSKPYKRNATKASTSTRAKQKTAREDLELEKLAEKMNAQFRAVDQISLVVE